MSEEAAKYVYVPEWAPRTAVPNANTITSPPGQVRIVDVTYNTTPICGDCKYSSPLRHAWMTACAKVGRLVAHSRPVGECPSYKAEETK